MGSLILDVNTLYITAKTECHSDENIVTAVNVMNSNCCRIHTFTFPTHNVYLTCQLEFIIMIFAAPAMHIVPMHGSSYSKQSATVVTMFSS